MVQGCAQTSFTHSSIHPRTLSISRTCDFAFSFILNAAATSAFGASKGWVTGSFNRAASGAAQAASALSYQSSGSMQRGSNVSTNVTLQPTSSFHRTPSMAPRADTMDEDDEELLRELIS